MHAYFVLTFFHGYIGGNIAILDYYAQQNVDPSALCANGAVKLVDGRDRFEGRVELCIGGTWGTVCQDVFWDDADAQVICRQVGYTNPREALAVTAVDYGTGTGPIYLNGLNCTGNETLITDCQTLNPGGVRFCSHADDVGVICRGTYKH